MKLSKRILSLMGAASCIALIATACGGEESECSADQTRASINGGPEMCYDKCVSGACDAGYSCSQGLCLADAASNNTTNNTANNTTANNTTANNTTVNNANNSTPANNTTPTNNELCDTPLNLGPCEPLCQTGCLDGEACVVGQAPNAGLISACQPAGTGGAGAVCDQMNGCQAGFVCNSEDGMSGTCAELCAPGGAACAQAGATCAPANQAMTLGICVVPMNECDPLNDMCPAGEVCAPTTVGNQCIAGGGKALGESCNAQALECNKGLYCVDIGAGPICRALCNPTNSMCAAPGQCNAFQGQTDLGVCI